MRWWRALRALAGRARVHPQALLLGRSDQIRLAMGCKVGTRVRIDPGHRGRVEIGPQVWIAADVELQTDTRVQIGAGASVQRRCTINGSSRIGRGCILAPDVFVSSGTHPFRAIPHLPIREQESRLADDPAAQAQLDRPVWVQDDCWLGTHVVVCPGVTIGKGSVVGANAVVTRDVPPYSIVAGSPARVIGMRLNWRPPQRIDPGRDEDGPYLLDAQLRTKGGARVVELTASSPLLAAMAAPPAGGQVTLIWRSASPAELDLGGRRVALPTGGGSLGLALTDLRLDDGMALCAVSLVPGGAPDVCVDILALALTQG